MRAQKRAAKSRVKGYVDADPDPVASRAPAVGEFPSMKMQRLVGYTSLIELDLLFILDFHPYVEAYQERPYSFEYPHISESRKILFTPDYIVQTPERTLMVECLSSRLADTQRAREMFSALRLWCATCVYSLDFAYVTERDLRSGCYLDNVKLLTRYARLKVDPGIVNEVLVILGMTPTFLTIGQLAMQLCPDFPEDPIPALLSLAYKGEIYIPIHDWAISDHSPVFIPEHLPFTGRPSRYQNLDIPQVAFLKGSGRKSLW